MKKLSRTQKGDLLVFASCLPWAFFPIFAKASYSSVSLLFSAGISTCIGGIFAAGVVTWQKGWGDWKKGAWKEILFATAIIGVFYYGMTFWGIKYTSAGNASIIALLEIFFTFAFFRIWKQEYHDRLHLFGAFLMVFGAMLVLFPGRLEFQKGDIIILLAAIIPPLGNYYQQEARKKVSTAFLLSVRNIISGIILVALSFLFSQTPSIPDIKHVLLPLFLNGVLVFGLSKLVFVESYHYISVSRAITLTSFSPILTLIAAYYFLNEIPTIWHVAGVFLIFTGIIFLNLNTKNEAH